jgi:hypothetical protein
MLITLNHDQVQRLRAYIDIANCHIQAFRLAGITARLNCTIDDTHAMLCLEVDAKPSTATELMRVKKMSYRSVDYHAHETHPTATYCIESFGHEVMVIARSPVAHVAGAGNVICVSNGDGMGGLNDGPDDRRYKVASSELPA